MILNNVIEQKNRFASGSYNTGSIVPPHTFTTVPFYIIAGQSNCGRARTSSMSSGQNATYSISLPNQYIYNPVFDSTASRALKAGTDTLLVNPNNTDEFGPETSLAVSFYSASAGTERRYLKYGVGNTDLATQWVPGTGLNNGLKYYVDLMIVEAKLQYKLLDLKGFIWMQGENDATDVSWSAAYGANLTSLFNDFTTFWNGKRVLYGLPTGSFSGSYCKVIGKINGINDTSEVYRTVVRAAQVSYCLTGSNNAFLIDTDSYPLQDTVHYNPTGQIQFGLDIYNQIKNI